MKSASKKQVAKLPVKRAPSRSIKLPSAPRGRQLLPWTGLILLLAVVVFSPALQNKFVNWDDYDYIRDNPLITSITWQGLQHLFHYKTFVMGNYHPLTILSYSLEYQLAGLNPLLYHLDNILLHLLNIVLITLIAWKLSGKIYATLIIAALFALHPMRVESVVWAAERKDVLYTLFYLLSLICYIYYATRQSNRPVLYILSMVFFLLSILSKGQAVVLPLTFLLVDYWYRKKPTWKTVLEKIPFFAMALLFGILAMLAQSSSLTTERLQTHSFGERLIFAAYNISAYLYKLVFPYHLAAFYGYPQPDEMMPVYAGAFSAILLLAFVLIRFRHNRTILFGSLFFLFTIFIVIQIIPIGNAIIADRYTYIPYIGLFFIIGLLCEQLITQRPGWGKAVKGLIILQLLVFGLTSYIQAGTWKDNETLWKQVLSINPKEGTAHNNIGLVYLEKKEYTEAIGEFQQAIFFSANYPEYYKAHHNLGKLYHETGNYEKAVGCYTEALSVVPGFTPSLFGRGLSFTEMGRYDAAIDDFTSLLAAQPGNYESLYSRAIVYNKKHFPDSAVADYTRAIVIKADYGDAYMNRGNVYYNSGKTDEAIMNYNKAIELLQDKGQAYMNRSFAYFRKNDFIHALEDAEKALSVNYNVNPAYLNDLKKQTSGH